MGVGSSVGQFRSLKERRRLVLDFFCWLVIRGSQGRRKGDKKGKRVFFWVVCLEEEERCRVGLVFGEVVLLSIRPGGEHPHRCCGASFVLKEGRPKSLQWMTSICILLLKYCCVQRSSWFAGYWVNNDKKKWYAVAWFYRISFLMIPCLFSYSYTISLEMSKIWKAIV